MPAINDRHILRLDLNLIRALAVLVQERSVTRAARRLCVTQSAASNMLSRLRQTVGDPILVRVGNAMVPTERAAKLADEIWTHLEALTGALTASADFDPAAARNLFKVGMPDYLAQTLVPDLSRALAAAAPLAQLLVRHASAEDYGGLLDRGEADLVISFLGGARSRHRTARLGEERFVCLHRPGLLGARPMTLDAYLCHAHVLVSFTGSLSGPVDEALGQAGRARRIAVAVPSFAAVPAILRDNPYLATVPSPFAAYGESVLGLATADAPLDLAPIPIDMAWHAKTDADPALSWLRWLVAAAVRIPATPTRGARG